MKGKTMVMKNIYNLMQDIPMCY